MLVILYSGTNLPRPGYSGDNSIPVHVYHMTAGDDFEEIAAVWLPPILSSLLWLELEPHIPQQVGKAGG